MNKINHLEITYSSSFEKSIIETAIQLQEQGLTEGPLLDGRFQSLTVYINQEPKSFLYHVYIRPELDISLKLTTLFYCKLTTPNRLPFSRSFSG